MPSAPSSYDLERTDTIAPSDTHPSRYTWPCGERAEPVGPLLPVRRDQQLLEDGLQGHPSTH